MIAENDVEAFIGERRCFRLRMDESNVGSSVANPNGMANGLISAIL